MIDYLLYEKIFKSNKNEEKKNVETYTVQNSNINYLFYYFLFAAILAAIFSWRCNSKANYPFSTKLLCSVSAFGYGTFYLIFYLIMYLNYGDTLCIINCVQNPT
jgi:hypothetical protein